MTPAAPPEPPPPDPAPDNWKAPPTVAGGGAPRAIEIPNVRVSPYADPGKVDALVSELEAMRKGGDRLWLVSWDGHAYTLRPVGQIRRRVVVDPP